MKFFHQLLALLEAIPAALIDGTLYASAGMWGFLVTQFGTDEAAKYVDPAVLFWLRTTSGTLANVALNLKMFRSTAYSDYLQRKAEAPTKPTTP